MSSGPPAEQQELVNIPGQNPVAYVACSSGNNELGFRSFIQTAGMTTGLTDGDKFGVIGDTTTSMNGDNGQGGLAPDGSQYFMISDTDAFVHIHIDAVRVVDYVNVKMGCWVHVESTAWETSDRLRVWVTEENLAESFEQPTWDVDGVLAPNPASQRPWSRGSGTTSTAATGPDAAHDGAYYLYTDAAGHVNEEHILVVPQPLAANNNHTVMFHYHMYGAGQGSLAVQIADVGGSTWTTLWSRSGQQQTSSGGAAGTSNWLEAIVPFASTQAILDQSSAGMSWVYLDR